MQSVEPKVISQKKHIPVEIKIEFLHEKGFGVGVLDGKKVGVYGVLPGEKVLAIPTKKTHKVKIYEVFEILEASPFRVDPRDNSYLSTSPFQIMSDEGEYQFKINLVKEKFKKHGINKVNDFVLYEPRNRWNYRNKVEFCFYHDENDLLHLAFRQRGSHWGKVTETNSAILNKKINEVGQRCLDFLRKSGEMGVVITGKNLKGLKITYSSKNDNCVAVFYVKDRDLLNEKMKIELEKLIDGKNVAGVLWAYSSHLSPQYRVDELEFKVGGEDVEENILDKTLAFHHSHFFQGNIEGFNEIMRDLRKELENIPRDEREKLFDFYSGVGTIGIVVGDMFKEVIAVEESKNSREYAIKNAENNGLKNYIASEKRFEDWDADDIKSHTAIIDPPRSGLTDKALEKLLKLSPKNLVYISCNPITQARDLEEIQKFYDLAFFKVYNLYPKTMHSESMAILRIKD